MPGYGRSREKGRGPSWEVTTKPGKGCHLRRQESGCWELGFKAERLWSALEHLGGREYAKFLCWVLVAGQGTVL